MGHLGVQVTGGSESRADGREGVILAMKLLARNRKLKENGPQMLKLNSTSVRREDY